MSVGTGNFSSGGYATGGPGGMASSGEDGCRGGPAFGHGLDEGPAADLFRRDGRPALEGEHGRERHVRWAA